MNNSAIVLCANRLSYTGQDCQRIPDALSKLYGDKVQCLDLSFNCLVSLRGLDAFVNLEELVLDNNQLTDNLSMPYLPRLYTLSLNKNNIANLEQLIAKIETNLPALTYLSLLGNKACPNQLSDKDKDENDYQRYRYYVLFRIPKLKFLDSTKVSETERSEAKRRGQFMKVVRPNDESIYPNCIVENSSNVYSPLPQSQRDYNDHKGAYGKCRYRYTGKHSEGNRFISNNDL